MEKRCKEKANRAVLDISPDIYQLLLICFVQPHVINRILSTPFAPLPISIPMNTQTIYRIINIIVLLQMYPKISRKCFRIVVPHSLARYPHCPASINRSILLLTTAASTLVALYLNHHHQSQVRLLGVS
jgi:hypothetical protein